VSQTPLVFPTYSSRGYDIDRCIINVTLIWCVWKKSVVRESAKAALLPGYNWNLYHWSIQPWRAQLVIIQPCSCFVFQKLRQYLSYGPQELDRFSLCPQYPCNNSHSSVVLLSILPRLAIYDCPLSTEIRSIMHRPSLLKLGT